MAHRVFAALYDRLGKRFELTVLGQRRARLVGYLTGHVLEVGAGTGANLPYFASGVTAVLAEPDSAMRKRLRHKVNRRYPDFQVSAAGAESLPFEDDSFDAVVFTLVLCTIPGPARALAEAKRVLRPGGRIVLLEHVRGTGKLARTQDRIAPVWSFFAAGCKPNRDTVATVEAAGFRFEELVPFEELPVGSPVRTMIEGIAVVR